MIHDLERANDWAVVFAQPVGLKSLTPYTCAVTYMISVGFVLLFNKNKLNFSTLPKYVNPTLSENNNILHLSLSVSWQFVQIVIGVGCY